MRKMHWTSWRSGGGRKHLHQTKHAGWTGLQASRRQSSTTSFSAVSARHCPASTTVAAGTFDSGLHSVVTTATRSTRRASSYCCD